MSLCLSVVHFTTDMIVIAGDLVDGTVAKLSQSATPLKELQSTHGTYFVTGWL